MISENGRFVISYNGEIYNFHELWKHLQLRGIVLNGHSDNEFLLEAISQWGLNETLRKANGMFAFAHWDRKYHRLTLAQDRVG